MMSANNAEERRERSSFGSVRSFGLSAIERACVRYLVGHTLACIEREFILQTLKSHDGNRTHSADRLGISIRSLRDRIRNYRGQGESVPEPGASCGDAPDGVLSGVRH
jgi:DNA-binding NtrC family response regulator